MIEAIPMASISPTSICFYNHLYGLQRTKRQEDTWRLNFKDNDTNGNISIKAKKRIVSGIGKLVLLSDWKSIYIEETGKTIRTKVTFITLTLPSKQMHTDDEIKSKCLNRFFETLREKHDLKAYLWRAESQKNGNIHFHIAASLVIHYKDLRTIWNNALEKLGYITEFEKIHKHRNPNSTDIHAIQNVKNLGAYLAKYCTKESEYRKIEGRQWYLSSTLSKIPSLTFIFGGDVTNELSDLLKTSNLEIHKFDFCDVVFVDFWNKNLKGYPVLQKLKSDYIKEYKTFVN